MGNKRARVYKRILKEIKAKARLYPCYADLHNQLGLLLMKEGNLDEAKGHFLKALRLNPNYHAASLNLGFLYIEQRRWKGAEEIFRRESGRGGKDGFLQYVLGQCYLRTGRRKEAAAQIRRALRSREARDSGQALRLDPSYRDRNVHRKPRPAMGGIGGVKGHNMERNYLPGKPRPVGGELHYQGYDDERGSTQEGVRPSGQEVERFLEKICLDYREAHFHNFVGLYLAREGKFAQAIQEFKEGAKRKRDEAIFQSNLGTAYYHRGAYDRAIEAFRKALKIDPLSGTEYADLSYIYGLKGQTRTALRYMERAVQLNPRYADLHYNLALLYGDSNRVEDAISELRKALRINSNYLFARINLAVLYEDQNNLRAARREYHKVLQITPEDEHVRRRLEKIS